MIRLDAKQKDALRAIIKLWPEDQVVLVAAAAVSCFLELRRMTADIGLSVSLPIGNDEQELRRLGWVVLKMAAHVDRPAGREKDLGDIAVIVEGHIDEERRFSDEVIDLGLPYPDISPHLLGADLARLVNSEEREAIRNFLAMAHDEDDSHATLARMAQATPPEYRDSAQLPARLDAFERGLGVLSGKEFSHRLRRSHDEAWMRCKAWQYDTRSC